MQPPAARSTRRFFALLALAGCSGVAALGHQTVWFRSAVDVLGANTDTFAKVAGGFFLGLAIGAFLASQWQPSPARRWLVLAWVETGVAVLALPMLLVARNAEWLFGRPDWAPLIKWALPLLLVTPPALLMGLVLPWLLHALQSEHALRPRNATALYAVNTLGGVVGIPFVLLFALPAWGTTATALGLAAINLAVAAGFLALHVAGRDVSGHRREVTEKGSTPARLPSVWAVFAFGSGFLVLAMEVLFQLQLRQVSINSLFSSGGVLAVVLLALGTAPFLVGPLLRWTGSVRNALALASIAAALLCAVQPWLHLFLGNGPEIIPYELPAAPYAMALFGLALKTIAGPALLAGLVFPLLLHHATHEGGGNAARRTGRLLMWNGLGGWLGAEAANRWLAPAFGLWVSLGAVAAGYFALFLCLVPQVTAGRRRGWLAGAVATMIVLAASIAAATRLPNLGLEEGTKLAAVEVGREGVVAVVEHRPGDRRIVMNNTYTLGGSAAMANQERQAHLPLLLHGNARTVATLGVATGSTAGGVILHPNVERLDAIELSPLVAQFARDHFHPYNRGVFADPRVNVIQDDARWVIAHRPDTYDVVIGDLFMPWETGAGRLFTAEHFRQVRRSLKPGGLYCQWLPMFQLTRPQFDSILRTFSTVFGEVIVLRGDFYADLPIIGLVGGTRLDAINWPAVEAACARLRMNAAVTDPLVRHREGVAMMLVGEMPAAADAPVNTLANGWLEFDAGRNIIGMAEPWFVGVPLATLLRDAQRSQQSRLPADLQAAHESGQFFLTLEIAAAIRSGQLDSLRAQFAERIPESLREDRVARWEHWPSREKPARVAGPAD